MKICVLSGSPKGEESITLQHIRFLERAYPEHTFAVHHAGQHIGVLESKEEEFSKVIASADTADMILFATPVYYLLIPAQFKRFIELVFSRNARPSFLGKPAASLTTSIHFFDQTANQYLHEIAEDLGMKWLGSFMAKMDDLTYEEHQETLVLFARDLFETAAQGAAVQRTCPPLTGTRRDYNPAGIPMPLAAGESSVVIISDAAPGSNLEKMAGRLASCFGRAASIVPLDEAEMKGGCLGCCCCAFDNTCVYNDGFSAFWKENVLPAGIVVFAGTIKDRYLSAGLKQVFDRSFFMGHVPALAGKQVAYLIEGPYSSCMALQEALPAYTSVQGANLAGIVTDEDEVSMAIDGRIDALAARCLRLAQSGYVAPPGFPAIAGKKVFRDEIWGVMRAVFRADHRYYRSHGLYDFPHNNLRQRIDTALLSFLLMFPAVQKGAKKEMKQRMVGPVRQALETSRVLRRIRKEKGAGRQ